MTTHTAPPDEWTALGYFYLPIPYYQGRVLKCKGIACRRNMAHMLAQPGMVLLDRYMGDRITADTHTLFTDF
jgi:hypothetical protein